MALIKQKQVEGLVSAISTIVSEADIQSRDNLVLNNADTAAGSRDALVLSTADTAAGSRDALVLSTADTAAGSRDALVLTAASSNAEDIADSRDALVLTAADTAAGSRDTIVLSTADTAAGSRDALAIVDAVDQADSAAASRDTIVLSTADTAAGSRDALVLSTADTAAGSRDALVLSTADTSAGSRDALVITQLQSEMTEYFKDNVVPGYKFDLTQPGSLVDPNNAAVGSYTPVDVLQGQGSLDLNNQIEGANVFEMEMNIIGIFINGVRADQTEVTVISATQVDIDMPYAFGDDDSLEIRYNKKG